MMPYHANSLISFFVLASLSSFSHASNVDVNAFFHKVDNAKADLSRNDLFNEAVNAWDNLNARDRMVTEGLADKTSDASIISDVIGTAKQRGHDANIPTNWDRSKTQAFLDQTHQPQSGLLAGTATNDRAEMNAADIQKQIRQLEAINTRVGDDHTQINTLETTLAGDEIAQANRDRTASQHVQPVVGRDGMDGKDGIDGRNGVDGKDGMDGKDGKDGVTTTIIKVKTDTITQNQVKANTAQIARQSRANDLQIAQLEMTRLRIDENRADMSATKASLHGDELAQANRDRTASQHVQPVVGRDGIDGVTTTITRIETDTVTQNQVKTNAAEIAKQTRQVEATNERIDESRADISATRATLQGDELAQANRERTASQHVQAVVGKDGIDGKNGAAGKDGETGQRGKDGAITTITRVETDTATQQQVSNNKTAISSNTAAIRGVRSEQATQGEYIQRQANVINQHSVRIEQNSAAISRNSQRIDQNAKRIDDTREDLKRGLNNAAAMTGLHYHSNDAYALSAGTANGDGAALAGGLSHSLTDHTSATAQASSAMNGNWMASVGFSGDF